MNKQEIEEAIYELGKFATGETYDTEYTDLSIFDLAISAPRATAKWWMGIGW